MARRLRLCHLLVGVGLLASVLVEAGRLALPPGALAAGPQAPPTDPFLVALGGPVTDPAQVERVQQALARVAQAAGVSAPEVWIAQASEPNAFALPEGRIYITQGLLKLLANDDELAAVLAHELAHLVQGHARKQLALNLGLLVAEQLLLGRADPAHPADARAIAGLTYQLVTLQYGRDQETEADLLGQRWAIAAGYDPFGAPRALEALLRYERQQHPNQRLPEYARTHPLTENRIARLRGQAYRLGHGPATTNDLNQALQRYLDLHIDDPL